MKTLVLKTITHGVLYILLNEQNPMVDKIINNYLNNYDVDDWYIVGEWNKQQTL